MLDITPEAAQFIKGKQKPIYLDIPPEIGCCIHLREKPTIRFGQPHDPHNYELRTIQEISVFVPYDLPEQPLTVTLTSFLGFKNLSIEGWHLA